MHLTKVKNKSCLLLEFQCVHFEASRLFQNGSNLCKYCEGLSHDKRNCDTFHKFTDLAREDTELLGQVLTPSCCWNLEADQEEEEADEDKFSPHFIFRWFSGAGACASFSGGGELFKTADPHFELVASWGHPILPDWIASILLQMFFSDSNFFLRYFNF